jgi:serine/threonine protein kinase
MQSLRSSILKLRQKIAGDSKYFYPRNEVLELLSAETIRCALQKYDIVPPERLDDVTHQIHTRARRTFAILIVLADGNEREILQFIKYDNFQNSPIDHRLPFETSELKRIIPKCYIDFYDKQWEFSAPVFLKGTEHRSLDEFAILPFITNKWMAEGGFGDIFRIEIHGGQQDSAWLGAGSVSIHAVNVALYLIDTKASVLIRKQLKEKFHASQESYQQEHRNLTLLGHIEHPHIQRLLSSYTFQEKHNFIFPLASGGDMETLFKADGRPPELRKDVDYYLALARLCSAVEAMHNFTVSKDLDIHILGLHRDIKPSNILVSGGDFILTDFGLSTFKSVTDVSTTPFREGGGDYLPPECEDLHTFRKGTVGRSGDIWALGCVMLELLVHMREGPAGILKFRDERVIMASWKTRTFHGPGKEVNPYVLSLMDKLHGSGTPREDQLIELVRSMLVIEPTSRLEAAHVTMRARLIAISELVCFLEGSYMKLLQNCKPIQVTVEFWKLKSWQHIQASLIKDDTSSQSERTGATSRFEEIVTLLCKSREEVDRVRAVQESTGRALFHDLRQMNDSLLATLPEEAQRRAWTHFELHCTCDEVESSLDAFEIQSDDLSVPHRLGTLAYARKFSREISMKNDTISTEVLKNGAIDLRVRSEAVDVEKSPRTQEYSLGWVATAQTEAKKRALIEWIRYDLHWEGDVQTEMVARVGRIATSLNAMASRADVLRILRCIHYYHSASNKAFGIIYELPAQSKDHLPRTLHSVINDSVPAGFVWEISLEDRFHLARTLAFTLLTLHKGTIVHKSISSHNIIFVSANESDLEEPYLIGFNYARPVEPKAFTTGPPPSKAALSYCHPEYNPDNAQRARPFRMVYDYYSLGLVLLEIGLWVTMNSLSSKSTRELKKTLLKSRVPMLKHVMGTAYRDAVEACLRDHIETDSPEAFEDTIMEFQKLVVEPLQKFPSFESAGDATTTCS